MGKTITEVQQKITDSVIATAVKNYQLKFILWIARLFLISLQTEEMH